MIVTIDKRGSINLPASIRKELGVQPGHHLELQIEAGGAITLFPVEFYRTVKLNDTGLAKLAEAREAAETVFPGWFEKELEDAGTDTESKIRSGSGKIQGQ